MTRFRSDFLAHFPQKLRQDLHKFARLVNQLEDALKGAPELFWPPPEPLLERFNYYLELVWQANCVRAVGLCRGMVESLNDSNFLSFAVLYRAFFEHVLLARQYSLTRIQPTVDRCLKTRLIESADLEALISELDTSIHRSRVDWEELMKGNFDDIGGTGTNIWDKLTLKGAAKSWSDIGVRLGKLTPTALYDVLCDLAHPNLGSAAICMKRSGFGFTTAGDRTVGFRVFGFLYPSLAAVAGEFQNVQNRLQLLKLTDESAMQS